jgi:hypothetical protein
MGYLGEAVQLLPARAGCEHPTTAAVHAAAPREDGGWRWLAVAGGGWLSVPIGMESGVQGRGSPFRGLQHTISSTRIQIQNFQMLSM